MSEKESLCCALISQFGIYWVLYVIVLSRDSVGCQQLCHLPSVDSGHSWSKAKKAINLLSRQEDNRYTHTLRNAGYAIVSIRISQKGYSTNFKSSVSEHTFVQTCVKHVKIGVFFRVKYLIWFKWLNASLLFFFIARPLCITGVRNNSTCWHTIFDFCWGFQVQTHFKTFLLPLKDKGSYK